MFIYTFENDIADALIYCTPTSKRRSDNVGIMLGHRLRAGVADNIPTLSRPWHASWHKRLVH